MYSDNQWPEYKDCTFTVQYGCGSAFQLFCGQWSTDVWEFNDILKASKVPDYFSLKCGCLCQLYELVIDNCFNKILNTHNRIDVVVGEGTK